MSRALSLSKVVLSILLACVFAARADAALIAEIGINIPPTFDPAPPTMRFGVVPIRRT